MWVLGHARGFVLAVRATCLPLPSELGDAQQTLNSQSLQLRRLNNFRKAGRPFPDSLSAPFSTSRAWGRSPAWIEALCAEYRAA
jgi:hypothetical protein